jgi:hypothetical protein
MLLLLFCLLPLAALAHYVPGRAFDRILCVWLENQDFDSVDKDSHFADLTREGILLTRFYGLTHPSQPNYIAAIGGDHFGLNHDNDVQIPANISTIVDLLDWGDVSWKAYMEDISGPGFMGSYSDGLKGPEWYYVRKHKYAGSPLLGSWLC